MATFSIVLDTRTLGRDGRYPLSLRVCFERKTRFLTLDARYTIDEYNSIFKTVPKGTALKHRLVAEDILQRALKINDNLNSFNYEEFKTLFRKKEKPITLYSGLISNLFELYINDKNLSLNTKKSYIQSKNSLLAFQPNLRVIDINRDFLLNYEDWFCKKNGNKISGALGIYLRSLRAVINYGIQKGIIDSNYIYPFRNHIYTIPTIRRVKRTHTSDQLNDLVGLNTFDSKEQEYALLIWKLQLYCNGINMKDLLLLKWSDIEGNFFVIIREKTKRTARTNPRPIKIPITSKLRNILDKIGDKKSPYVLGILTDKMSESQILEKKRRFSKMINKHLKVIGDKLNFEVPLLSKTARDSYATSLMRAGVSIDEISKSIGHSNSITTQHYLGDFDEKHYFDVNSHLP